MNKKVLTILFIFIAVYPVIIFPSPNKFNLFNFLIYLSSIIILGIAYTDIQKRNIRSYSIFALFFYGGTLLNTLNMSGIQIYKDGFHFFAMIIVPLIFILVLYFFEHVPYPYINFRTLNLNGSLLSIILLGIYVGISYYIYTKVGLRIYYFMGMEDFGKSGNLYAIPGFTGTQTVVKWTLLILAPYQKKNTRFIVLVSIILISVVLHVKRGDILRIAVFYFVLYTIENYRRIFTWKYIKIVGASVIGVVVVFSGYGEIRNTYAENVGRSDLSIRIESKIDNVALDWVYAYWGLNFEVLFEHMNNERTYSPRGIGTNLVPGLYDEDNYYSYRRSIIKTHIRGLNASTFMGKYMTDYGEYFFLEVFMYAILVGLILYGVRIINSLGVYAFLITLIAFAFFNDYVLPHVMLFSILFSSLLSISVLKADIKLKSYY